MALSELLLRIDGNQEKQCNFHPKEWLPVG